MSQQNTLKIQDFKLDQLKKYNRPLKIPGENQLSKTVRFLEQFGMVTPIVVDEEKTIVIGELFYHAALELSFEKVPVVQIQNLSKADIKMLRIAYERIAEEAEWDKEALKLEFEELQILIPEIDLTLTGFDVPEIDFILNLDEEIEEENIPEIDPENAMVQKGDLYQLGNHRLFCGDALEEESYQNLLVDEQARMVFTDAPYNVKIDGHVGNSGEIKHREFEMASGEMSVDEFTVFLTKAHHHMASVCVDGAILFSCMDWRHIQEMLTAATKSKLDFKNLCVWTKDNGGMGSLYRSQHELVFVFKKGQASHINNVQLGKHGRCRTNVWQYPGVNSFGGNRMDDLKLHPTVKPVQMVADAIMDCSNPKDIVLDPFGGSGSTLIAAERTGRYARLIELDPLYCDVIIRRWEQETGEKAVKLSLNKEEQKRKGA